MQILSFLAGLMTLASSSTSTLPVESPVRAEIGSSTIKQLIYDKGLGVGLSEAKIGQIFATIECESRYRNIQSQIVKDGIQELSFGISQISIIHHPHITKEMALDIEYSVNFIVDEFAKGHEKKWSCWRKLYPVDN